jgi:serine/threonine protein phosphatase PrpC
MKFSIFHDSRIGRRAMNQDRLAWAQSDEAVFLVVADGMGGHRHGEVAAQIAVQHLATAFRNAANPALDSPAKFLRRSIGDAHRAINDYTSLRAIPLSDSPRTTCVACVVQDGYATWAHVGDSRLYLVRGGRTIFRTLDHSHVQMMIDAGEITAEEALHHPQRNLVSTCLGGDVLPRIDISEAVMLLSGDTLALCSDGVWGPLGDALPAGLTTPLESNVPRLLDTAEANAGPGCDNLSLIALRWESVSGKAQSDEETRPFRPSQTLIEDFTAKAVTSSPLSDAEFDLAVSTIRSKLRTQNPNGTTK